MNKTSGNLVILITFLLLQYVIVTVFLMLNYDGGNLLHPHANHFILDRNYLSDLGRSITFNGQKNNLYFLYTLTLGLVGIATILFTAVLSKSILLKHRFLPVFFGWIAGIGYIGIALTPVNQNLQAHIIFGKLAFLGFFVASILISVLMNRKKYSGIFKLISVLNFLLFFYLLLMFFGPHSSDGIQALQIKTIAQKSMVYLQIFLSVLILVRLQTIKS